MQQTRTSKKLTRIKLVNWHLFGNETITLNGSCLISGDNGAGKSTVMDAIQMVLTANTRKFNFSSNEKSKRELKGYIRLRTGEEGNVYARKGYVISYVALEFYEESFDRFFVIGGRFESPDEDSEIKKAWFCEKGSLDNLSFIINNRPALDDQFRNNGNKISYIRSAKEARGIFKHQLGNLEDNFFEMVPKSLAFRPMDNVKKFITQFILPEKSIDVEVLRENIQQLREMQILIAEVRNQIAQLEAIIETGDKMSGIEKELKMIEIILNVSQLEAIREKIDNATDTIEAKEDELEDARVKNEKNDQDLISERDRLGAIRLDIGNNECSKLIDQLKNSIQLMEKDQKSISSGVAILHAQLEHVGRAFKYARNLPDNVTAMSVRHLGESAISPEERREIFSSLKICFRNTQNDIYGERAELRQQEGTIKGELTEIRSKIDRLKKNQIDYPINTRKLQDSIQNEFEKRGIDSEVRVFADLIEVSDPRWQNAAEGYLGNRRFNIIVEPQYYDIAADVYDRMKNEIENVALVNTQALDLECTAQPNTLATVLLGKNRYATAYVNEAAGRVVLCDDIKDLKKHSSAITDGCMLYQSKVLRKLPASTYARPYIGKGALARQMEMENAEYIRIKNLHDEMAQKISCLETTVGLFEMCKFELIDNHLNDPIELCKIQQELAKKSMELESAQNNPDIIELSIKERECTDSIQIMENNRKCLEREIFCLEHDIKTIHQNIENWNAEVVSIEENIAALTNGDETIREDAEQQFSEDASNKTFSVLNDMYTRKKNRLDKQQREVFGQLVELQTRYKDGEYGTGVEVMQSYADEYLTLSKHNLVDYEDRLAKAKDECELEFRENFLACMRENIESAQSAFKDLNKALKNIYYGNDSYKFHCTANKMKAGLYEMITSDVNVGGFTLFSSEFEEKYHSEMEDLFMKLSESDASGDAILREYTDYREYMDYDIEVISKDGKSQFFSKNSGEKSGGEIQTPYYVAIAASFAQMYSVGETIRIVMLDEAFDKMDDGRISSMMKFLVSQNFQVIIATPLEKVETIGEHVDTILMAYRDGYSSSIEEYKLG